MAVYFASDVHLRLDRPERGRRFARWLASLGSEDTLWIVGDLCDFWFAAREIDTGLAACAGLQALAAFRSRGGKINILPGNHDTWLGPFYERNLSARFVQEPVDVEVHGLRVHMVHGHRLGARRLWKACMESRGFLRAFHHLPSSWAHGLDRLLEWTNEKGRAASEARHLAVFRQYAAQRGATADLIVIGHIHTPADDAAARPRMIVLGGWHHQTSYLKIDASGAALMIEADPAPIPC